MKCTVDIITEMQSELGRDLVKSRFNVEAFKEIEHAMDLFANILKRDLERTQSFSLLEPRDIDDMRRTELDLNAFSVCRDLLRGMINTCELAD